MSTPAEIKGQSPQPLDVEADAQAITETVWRTMSALADDPHERGRAHRLLVLVMPKLWVELRKRVEVGDPFGLWSVSDDVLCVFDAEVHPVDEPLVPHGKRWRIVRDLGLLGPA